MKGSIFIATSLDGFIARENGSIDWLEGWGGDMGEDYGYRAFMETVDALVMGRHTYEQVLTFGEWPYEEKPVVVLTHRPLTVPDHLAGRFEVMSGSPVEVVQELTRRGANQLYIDGGKTIQDFLNAGFIQRIILTRIPVLIGTGIPLFGPITHDIALDHITTRQYPDGLVQSEYAISVRPAQPDRKKNAA